MAPRSLQADRGIVYDAVMDRIVATTVAEPQSGIALIDFLCEKYRYCDRAEWIEHISADRIAVNSTKVKADQVLETGDRIRFFPPEGIEPIVDFEIPIVFENDDFLILDKPPNLPCHPGGRFFKHSLWYILKIRMAFVHIATRLDRETSGLAIVCKNKESAAFLSSSSTAGELSKTYLAIVHGEFAGAMTAKGYIALDEHSRVRKKRTFLDISVDPGELPASAQACETSFSLIRHSAGFSLVEARPRTGRTHQIRATLSSLGYPVAGDKLYGLDESFFIRFAENALSQADRAALILPAQALHCSGLSFRNRKGDPISVEIGSPLIWRQTFSALFSQG
jgi:23S rRNA pseudouridine955/2504/2580 synthase/23S rRNA pseudouridine1911/1915/1917 synthase